MTCPLSATTLALACTLFCTTLFAQQKGTYTDMRNDKKYKTVKIGSQIWMAENLNYEMKGSKCYNNEPANCQIYGRLYDWDMAMKACPKGWRLPTMANFKALMEMVDGSAKFLKAADGWGELDGGVDIYGFSALPGGDGYSRGGFYGIGKVGYWWSTDKNGIYFTIDKEDKHSLNNGTSRNSLLSVRCIQN